MDLPGDHLSEKRKNSMEDMDDCDEAETLMELSSDAPKSSLDREKKLRRVIANSNERRRMQSINAGFQCLRTLIPNVDGEKLSKAAILHQTGDYISELEREKSRLLSQNTQLKQMIRDLSRNSADADVGAKLSPPPKRKKRDTESSDEGIGMGYEDFSPEELKKEIIEIRTALDREKRLRQLAEEERTELESRLYPERLNQVVDDVEKTKIDSEPKCPPPQPKVIVKPVNAETVVQRSMPAPATLVIRNPLPTPSEPAALRSQHPVPQHPVPAPPAQHPVPQPPPPAAAPILSNSVSRRNLETIVEAIRHLEGDILDGMSGCSFTAPCIKEGVCSRILHSDDSEKESSGSELEDCKSDCSDRSPLHQRGDDVIACTSAAALLNLRQERNNLPLVAPTVTVVAAGCGEYPAVTSQLHPGLVTPVTSTQTLHHTRAPHFFPRPGPGVITQKSA